MDKSEDYYIRCIEAAEIQKEWSLQEGDFFAQAKAEGTSHKVLVLSDWETRDDIIGRRDSYVWLPRLDQLQKMIDWTLWEFKITKKSEIEMLYSAISEQVSSGSVAGITLEQVWLAFVMKEKYKKTWDRKQSKWREVQALPS